MIMSIIEIEQGCAALQTVFGSMSESMRDLGWLCIVLVCDVEQEYKHEIIGLVLPKCSNWLLIDLEGSPVSGVAVQ